MNPIRSLARPMLASMFLVGGVDAIRDPGSKVPVAKDVAPPIANRVPWLEEMNTEELIRLNGVAQVAGGTLLALGKLPRLSSAVLAATLVPTTAAGHRFWEEEDPGKRANQQVHFFKNVSMLGGLAIAAMDTAGRPSLAWRAGHAVEHASTAIDRTRREAKLARKLAKAETKRKAQRATDRSRREAKLAAKLAKAEGKRRLTPDVFDVTRGVRSLTGSDDD